MRKERNRNMQGLSRHNPSMINKLHQPSAAEMEKILDYSH
jgi:hypothetical protein